MLESFGAFEFGGEDEGIEAGFVHTVHHLISAGGRGCNIWLHPTCLHGLHCITTIVIIQRITYILCAKHRFALSVNHGADGTELLVSEN